MSWIDITILALVVLLGLVGVWKGAKKSALALGAFAVAFLLAFFLSNVVAEALLGIDGVKSFVLGNGFGDGAQWSLAYWLYKAPANTSITPDSFIFKNFFAPMTEIVVKADAALPVDQGLAVYGAFLIFSAICGVGIFIVSRFLLVIVTVIIKSYIGKKQTVLSRLIGFMIGAARGALWAFAFTLVFSCFGGYMSFQAINNVQKEYENNAVVCQYFNQGAYGMRNKLFLPDSDTYGRLVDMLVKKQTPPEDNKHDKLNGDRLNLFIGLSNLNYQNSPWSIDENRKRKFDEADALARSADEFASVEFDTVMRSILDYNMLAAQTVDDTEKLKDLTEEDFANLVTFVKQDGSSVTLDTLMNELWVKLRNYVEHYVHPDQSETISAQNSTLKKDYDDICGLIDNIRDKYKPISDKIGAFPELQLPEQKKIEDENAGGEVTPPETDEGGETPEPDAEGDNTDQNN